MTMRLDSYNVPRQELKISASFDYHSDSLGGESSGTDTAHKGIKPKVFSVRLIIPYDRADDLTRLVNIAQAVDDNGDLHVYDVAEKTINAMNVRQVKFTRQFRSNENDSRQVWEINFNLQEHHSTPEKIEQRIELSNAETETSGSFSDYTAENLLDPQFRDILNYSNKALT